MYSSWLSSSKFKKYRASPVLPNSRLSPVSKLNTFLQILLVVLIMLEQVEWLVLAALTDAVLWLVVATTLASAFHYVYFWVLRSSDAAA